MGFDEEIDYISHHNALRWVLIRKLIIFPIARHYDEKYNQFPNQIPSHGITMGFDKEIDYISHRYALRWNLIRELI